MSDTVAHESLEGTEPTGGAAGGSRRLLMLVAGGAAVLVLGLAVYFLFLSGGEEEVAGPVVPAPTASEKPAKGDKGDKDDTDVPKEVDADFAVGRDPFAPLAVEAVKEEPVDTGDADTGGAAAGGTDPVTDPGTPAPAPTVAPVPAPTVEPVTTYKVKLISVDLVKDKATIEVDGKRYVLAVKDMFPSTKSGPFQLTSVDERPSGKDTAMVVFGADAPVELVQKDAVVFEN